MKFRRRDSKFWWIQFVDKHGKRQSKSTKLRGDIPNETARDRTMRAGFEAVDGVGRLDASPFPGAREVRELEGVGANCLSRERLSEVRGRPNYAYQDARLASKISPAIDERFTVLRLELTGDLIVRRSGRPWPDPILPGAVFQPALP